jgi:hypothetical protein
MKEGRSFMTSPPCWDHLIFWCATQRGDSIRRDDLVAAHDAQLLHELSDEGLSLLRRAPVEGDDPSP